MVVRDWRPIPVNVATKATYLHGFYDIATLSAIYSKIKQLLTSEKGNNEEFPTYPSNLVNPGPQTSEISY